jgi:glycosyltransferase involved in cell wall biosynthesis
MRDLAAKNEHASLDYYHHASKIICCSENICEFVHSDVFLNERTIYIPIPFKSPDRYTREELDFIKKKYGLDAVARYICFAGAILKYKGVFDLMEALKILLSEGRDWRLVLIGPMELGKDSEEFKRFQSEINSSQIIYLGPLGREDTLGLIQDSDIFILPSTTEGLPRVCLEAIALGVKAILPGCVPEFKKHCPDFVLDEINPVKIAKKIMQVSKSDKRPTYPFSIHDCSQIIDQTYSLYGELIRNGKRPPVAE